MNRLFWLLIGLLLLTPARADNDPGFLYLLDMPTSTLIRIYEDGTRTTFDLDPDPGAEFRWIMADSMLFTEDGRRAIYCRMTEPEKRVDILLRDLDTGTAVVNAVGDDGYCRLSWVTDSAGETHIHVALLRGGFDPETPEVQIREPFVIDADTGALLDSVEWQPDLTTGERRGNDRDVLPATQESVWLGFDPTLAYEPDQPFSNVVMYQRGDAEPYPIFVTGIETFEMLTEVAFIEGGARIAVSLTERLKAVSENSRWEALDRDGGVAPLDVRYGDHSLLRGTADGFIVLNRHRIDVATGLLRAELLRSANGRPPELIAEVLFERTPFELVWLPPWQANPDMPPFPAADWYAPIEYTPGLG